MIKGSATIQFGSGSVASAYGIDPDNGTSMVCMRSCAPGKIGVDPKRVDFDLVMNEPEVVIFFTNVESLDMFLDSLNTLRLRMVEYGNRDKKKCKYHDPKMDELLSYCKRLYQLPGCGAGGCLHILLDDDNYQDSNLEWCRGYCEENAKGEEYELAMKILDMYSAMSLTERTVFDWYLNGNNLECSDPTKCETCDLCEIPDYMEDDL